MKSSKWAIAVSVIAVAAVAASVLLGPAAQSQWSRGLVLRVRHLLPLGQVLPVRQVETRPRPAVERAVQRVHPAAQAARPALPVRLMHRLHAPLAWEQAFSTAHTRIASVFTAVDLAGYEYNHPPYEPHDPSPANGATNVAVTANLAWVGGDPDTADSVTYDVYFGTVPNPPLMASGVSEASWDAPALAYQATYHWKIVARDESNAVANGPVWTFTTESSDSAAPVSTITDPAAGAYLRGATYVIRGTAADTGGSGVQTVQVSTDGMTWRLADGTANWSYTWTLPADGSYTLTARATDAAGNEETPGPGVTVTVDNTPPQICLAGFYDTSVSHSQGGHATLLAYVPAADVVSVEIGAGGQGAGVFLADDGTQGDLAAGDRLYMLAAQGIGPGTAAGEYLAELVATDRAGNKSDAWPYLRVHAEAGNGSTGAAGLLAPEFDWTRIRRSYLAGAGQAPADRPQIWAGGYWESRVSTAAGGALNILAVVFDPQDDVQSVELYYAGVGTGVYLRDDGLGGDWSASDTIFTWFAPEVGSGVPASDYLLETVAIDRQGNESLPYPYLTVEP